MLDIPDWLPLFPLPNCVLLPRAILPLHVFEERYRLMTRDVLAGDRMLAVALLKPCTQEQYLTLQAPIHSAVGVGRVVKVEHLADGRFNFLLQGVERMEVQSENSAGPYRRARCRVIPTRDLEPGQECRILRELRQHLSSPVLSAFSPLAKISTVLDCCTFRLADKLDAVASVVVSSCEDKQRFLESPCVAGRAELLFSALARLEGIAGGGLNQAPAPHAPRRDCWN